MFKHTIIQQEMLMITVLKKQRKCFLIVQLEIIRNWGPFFRNSLDKTVKHSKTTKHFGNQLKSILHLNTTDLIWSMPCVFLCTLFCKVYFLQVSVYFLSKPLLRAWFSQAVMTFWSCPQYHFVFFKPICFDVWYWNKVWYDWLLIYNLL